MACEIKNIHVVTIHSAFGGTLCIGCTIMFLKCNNISFVKELYFVTIIVLTYTKTNYSNSKRSGQLW